MSAKKYKPGDKVMVRPDFHKPRSYGEYGIGVNAEMLAMKSQILTIKDIDCTTYSVRENVWWWTDEMLVDYIQPCETFKHIDDDSSYIPTDFKSVMTMYGGK